VEIERRLEKAWAEHRRLLEQCEFEHRLWSLGYDRVAGVDEVGRGALAGPVVAGAVILSPGTFIAGLDDSKVLTTRQREGLWAEVRSRAVAVAIGSASPAYIDRYNIHRATLQAMLLAVAKLRPAPDHLLVDALRLPGANIPQWNLVHGDARSCSIAAAAVVAKVTRDRLMARLDTRYPGYGFAVHKGYATAAHLEALARLGPSPIHRHSFAPVAASAAGGRR
jgi:ribonuclease HII